MEKFLDELILGERKKRKEKVLDEQIDLERDLPEQYLQTVEMSDKTTSIKLPAFMKDQSKIRIFTPSCRKNAHKK